MGFNSGFKGLNSICHLLELLGVHHFLHVSRIRVKYLKVFLLLFNIISNLCLHLRRSLSISFSEAELWMNFLSFPFLLYVLSIFLLTSLSAELNPICYLLALLGAHHFLHVSRIRVNWTILVTLFLIVRFPLPFCHLLPLSS